MVGIISNDGLGLFDSSMDRLGTSHGQPNSLGQAKGNAYVNIATGNLSVQFLDESLSGSGADLLALRTYNSKGDFTNGAHDGDNDGWRWLGEKRVILNGTLNSTTSTVELTLGDGGNSTFTWLSTNKYRSTDGSGAHDILEWNTATSEWKLTEDGGTTEHYFRGSDGWISRTLDTKGTGVGFTYTFTNNKISSVSDMATGQRLDFFYGGDGSKLTELKTFSKASSGDAGTLLKQVSYTYYGANETGEGVGAGMLKTVTTDLFTPANATYTTTYTYFSDKKVKGISQSDGTNASFTYDGSGRILKVNDQMGETTFVYNTNSTTVKNSLNNSWTYTYDATSKQLKTITNSDGQVSSYDYEANGDVKFIANGTGNTVTFAYDPNGNRIGEVDTLGNKVTRTFGLKNELLTETRFSVASLTAPSGAETTRYVYDGNYRLAFVVTAEGRVSENTYNSGGLLTHTRQYAAESFDLTAIPSPSLTDLTNWRNGLTADKKKQQQLTKFDYDYRGNLQTTTSYSKLTSTGEGDPNEVADVTQYSYDEYGRLLHTIISRTTSDKFTAYTYDGMGRQLSVVNDAGTTTTAYSGVTTTVSNAASGLTVVSTTDTWGRLTSVSSNGNASNASGGDNVQNRITKFYYDNAGQLRMTEDPSGARSYVFYDAVGRVSHRVDATGAVSAYTYNNNNQVKTETLFDTRLSTVGWFDNTKEDGSKVVKTYITADIVTNTSKDRKATKDYDEAGRLKESSLVGTTTIYSYYDGASRLIRTVQGDRITRYFYDKDGRQIGLLNAEGNFAETVYDAAGRVSKAIRYDGKVTTANQSTGSFAVVKGDVSANATLTSYFFYDAEGRQVGVVNEQGFLTETVYDAINNLRKTIQYETAVNVVSGSTLDNLRTSAGVSNTTTTKFDKFGRVETVTAQDLTVSRNIYDSAGRLMLAIQADGTSDQRASGSRYNAFGEIIGLVSGTSLTSTSTQADINTAITSSGKRYDVDGMGRKIAEYQPNGQKTLLFYNTAGQLTYTVNALGEVSKTTYNSFGQVAEVRLFTTRLSATNLANLASGGSDTNIASKVVTSSTDSIVATSYNQFGQVDTLTDAEGYKTLNTYNAFGELEFETRDILLTPATTVQNQYGRDKLGRVIWTKNDVASGGLNIQTSATIYDGFGRVKTITNANGNITTTNYLSNAKEIEIVDAVGGKRKTTVDYSGRTLSVIDANGQETKYVYDNTNRKITVTSPEGVVVTTWKNRTGETLQVQDGKGQLTTYTYTKDGQLNTVTDSTGATTSNVYDSSDRLYESTDTNGVITRYSYDAANRLIQKSIDPSGLNICTQYEFDGQGRQIYVTEAYGTADAQKTQYVYDRKGQISQIIVDPLGLNLVTNFTYDGAGRTIKVDKGSAQQVTEYKFDALGRKISEQVDPSGLNLTTLYQYDNNGNVIKKIDANNNPTSYVYDAANRLCFVIDAEGSVTENIYDANGNVVTTFQYDKLVNPGLITSENDVRNALFNWAQGFSSNTNGLTLPPNSLNNYSLANGNLVMTSVKTASGTSDVVYQATGTTRGIGTGYRFSFSTDGASGNHYGYIGLKSSDNKRRHLLLQSGNTFYVQYKDSNNAYQLITLGQIKDNTAYVLEYETDNLGTTLYLFEKGSSRATGFANRIDYSDWSDVATFLQVKNSSSLAQTTSINVDGIQEYWLPETRKTQYVYDKDNRLRFAIDATGAVTEKMYDNNGNVVRLTQFATKLNPLANPTVTSMDGLLDRSNAGNRITSYLYDNANRLRYSIDAEGGVTENIYDLLGNIVTTTQHSKKVDPSATYSEYILKSTIASWANGFSSGAAGYTLPASNITAGGGNLVLGSTKTAAGTATVDYQAWGTTRNVGTAFNYEFITDGAVNQHYGSIGINSSDLVRRHVIHQENGNFYVKYMDAGVEKSRILGAIKENTRYILEIETDAGGTTLYLYESGKSRSSGYKDYRNYADWKDVASWMVARSSPDLAANTNVYVDVVREFLPSNARTTKYVYDTANRLRYSLTAEGAVTESIYDSSGNLTSTIQYEKKVNSSALHIEYLLRSALASWATGFSTSSGYTLPANNITVSSGNLVINNVKTAAGSATFDYQAWGTTRAVGTTFNYEFTTDGAANQHYGGIGINSTDLKRQHVVYQENGNFYAQYIDNGIPQRQLLGAIKENTRYILDIESDKAGTTLYLYESGKLKTSGFIDRRNYSDWKDVASWMVATSSPTLAATTNIYVDVAREFLPSNTRVTKYVYDAADRLRFTVDAEGAVTESVYDNYGNVIRKNEFSVIPNPLGIYTEANLNAQLDRANANNRTTSFIYDAANRLRFTINAEGAVTENIYDYNGNVTSTVQHEKKVDPLATYNEYLIKSALCSWANGFSGGSAGFTLPASNIYVQSGNLVIGSVKTAAGSSSLDYQAWGTTRTVGTTFNYEFITDGATNQHYGTIGINSTDLKRRHVVHQENGNFYVKYMDAGVEQSVLLGSIKENTRYILEIESDYAGTTLYLYESGKTKTTGFIDRRNFSDWKDVASWMVARTSPTLAANTNIYLDVAREFLPSNTRVTSYSYDKNNRQIKTTLAGWYDPATGRVEAASAAGRYQRTVEVTYDALGNAVANKLRTGLNTYAVQYKTYDKLGREVNDIDALGYITQKTYFATGEVKSVTRSANSLTGSVPSRGYWLSSEIATQTGRKIDFEYDRLGRQTKVTQPTATTNYSASGFYTAAAVSEYQYDVFGNLVKESSLIDNTTTKAETYHYYDVLGRKVLSVQVGEENNAAAYYGTETTYDVFGGVKTVTEYRKKATGTLGSTAVKPTFTADTTLDSGTTYYWDRTTDFTYDKVGRVTISKRRVNQEAGLRQVDKKIYNSFGEVAESIDVFGNSTTSEFNRIGQLTRLTEPVRTVGVAENVSLDVFNNTTNATPITEFTYNVFGEMTKEYHTANQGRVIVYDIEHVFDTAGNEIRTQDARGNWSDNTYNISGKVIRQTQSVSVTDATNDMNYAHTIERRFEYDLAGRQVASIDVFGSQQSGQYNTYNGYGEVTEEYKIWGASTESTSTLLTTAANNAIVSSYQYDGAGRIQKKISAEGNVYFYYDLMGRATRTEQRDIFDSALGARVTQSFYDRVGNVKEQRLPEFSASTGVGTNTAPLTPIIKQTFDRWGNVKTRTDAANNVTQFDYNQDNKLISEKGPKTSTLKLDGNSKDTLLQHKVEYDQGGRVVKDHILAWDVVSGTGASVVLGNLNGTHTTTNEYNAVGQLTRTIDATGVAQRFAYDVNGNRIGTKNGAGFIVLDKFDESGQIIENSILRIETNGEVGEYTGSQSGTLQAVKRATYKYDQAGRRYSEADGTGARQLYAYDERNNKIRERSRQGFVKIYNYDELSHKTQEIQEVTTANIVSTRELYNWSFKVGSDFKNYAVDQLQTCKIANNDNMIYDYVYSRFNQIASETLRGTSTIVSYSYWENGLQQMVKESKFESFPNAAYQSAYTIDQWNQSNFTYDINGNKKAEVVHQEFHQSEFTYVVPSGPDAGQHTSFAIDRVGNVETYYQYDEHNRLKNASSPWGNLYLADMSHASTTIDNLTYDYDEWGNRRRISSNYKLPATTDLKNKTEWFAYDAAGRVTAEAGVVVDGNVVANSDQGTIYSYSNLTGMRERQETYKGTAAWSNNSSQNYGQVYGEDYLVTSYLYNDMGLVKHYGELIIRRDTGANTSSAAQDYSVTISKQNLGAGYTTTLYPLFREQYEYDIRGFKTTTSRYKVDSDYSGNYYSAVETKVVNTYYADGGLDTQLTELLSNGDDRSLVDYAYNDDGTVNSFFYQDYNSNFNNTYTYTYVDTYAGRLVSNISVSSTQNYTGKGTTLQTYDSRGRLIRVYTTESKVTDPISTGYGERHFNYSTSGQIIGRAERHWGESLYKVQNFYYAPDRGEMANYGAKSVEISPLNAVNEGGDTPGSYKVSEGDTLTGIAQTLFGDSKLWYLIADANGLSMGPTDQFIAADEGRNLRIPNVDKNISNTSTNWNPYSPEKIVGDVTPNPSIVLPEPPQQRCGFLVKVISAVVSAIVFIVTRNPAAAAAAGNYAGQYAGVIANGDFDWKSYAEYHLNPAAKFKGDRGDILRNWIDPNAAGADNKIDYKSIGISAAAGAIAQGIAGAGGGFWAGVAQGATTYTVNYMLNKAAGYDPSFSLRSMAAQSFAQGVTNKMAEGVSSKEGGWSSLEAPDATYSFSAFDWKQMVQSSVTNFAHSGVDYMIRRAIDPKNTHWDGGANAVAQGIMAGFQGKPQESKVDPLKPKMSKVESAFEKSLKNPNQSGMNDGDTTDQVAVSTPVKEEKKLLVEDADAKSGDKALQAKQIAIVEKRKVESGRLAEVDDKDFGLFARTQSHMSPEEIVQKSVGDPLSYSVLNDLDTIDPTTAYINAVRATGESECLMPEAEGWEYHAVYDYHTEKFIPTILSSSKENLKWSEQLQVLHNDYVKLQNSSGLSEQAFDSAAKGLEHRHDVIYKEILKRNDYVGINSLVDIATEVLIVDIATRGLVKFTKASINVTSASAVPITFTTNAAPKSFKLRSDGGIGDFEASLTAAETSATNSARADIIAEANARSSYLKGKYGNLTSDQRMARIDEISRTNYEARLGEAINNQDYVFRYLSEDSLNTSLQFGTVRGYTTTEFTHSSSIAADGAQILPQWGVPQYGVAIPVNKLNGFSLARPMGNKASVGWEPYTNSYPSAGSGGFSQFLINDVPIDQTYIFRLKP